jgi:hypothetical protein
VGVEVAGVLPLVVVFCLVYNYMPFMGVLCFLIVFSVFLFRQAARCVRKAMPENLVKLVFVLSGFKSQRINANQVGDSLPPLTDQKKKPSIHPSHFRPEVEFQNPLKTTLRQ